VKELKYRAIIKEKNTTIYFTLQDIVSSKPLFSVRELLIPWLREGNIPDEYANDEDIDHKTIYSGDILEFTATGFGVGDGVKPWISAVVWDYGSWMVWQKVDSNSGRGHSLGAIEHDTFRRKVIGNVHENPELLNG
jgi:hypothetical protein